MAFGRSNRNDGRKSSNYCSTIIIVVMVSACLIGGWVMMSSSVDPDGNLQVSLGQAKDREPRKVRVKKSREFEDNFGDSSDDSLKVNVDQGSGRAERDSNAHQNEVDESKNTDEWDQDVKLQKENNDEDVEIKPSEKKEKNFESGDKNVPEEDEVKPTDRQESEENIDGSDHKTDEAEQKSGEGEKIEETKSQYEEDKQRLEKDRLDESKDSNEDSSEKTLDSGSKDEAEILKETSTQIGAWSTQSAESEKQKASAKSFKSKELSSYTWKLCNVTAGPDYIPCLDNIRAIRKLPSTIHYEHRERHCPDEAPTCLVSLPEGYKTRVNWPKSRDKIWFANVPHVKLAEYKGHQNWVQVSGEYLTFPGGGTQFTHGALRYIDFIQKTHPDIAWGKRTRVVLDVGCGVASFGGYLFDRDVITMSLAPKDEHEAQVQFALERGIPAISAVMGTKRLPFPSKAFDTVHCARCRVPWHVEGGKLLLELNRVLRPGGYFVWSATPVYRKDPENAGIWKDMSKLTKSMCWELVNIGKDEVNEVSAAVYRKPTSNDCYESRTRSEPPLCKDSDDPDAAWDVPLEACIHKVPTNPSDRGSQWPAKWPSRLDKIPYWFSSEVGVYGKEAPKDFTDDYKHWKLLVANSYLNGIGIDWSSVRNVMDMRATYGGFAAALKDLKLWVMNVVPISSSDTLPIIYERGLFGIYHDWCESFNTYPRTYDLLHADHLLSDLKKRCNIVGVMAEVDRILRPEGKLIVKDDVETIAEVESMAKSLHWKVRFTFSEDSEGLLCVQKTKWRPSDVETITSAIA